MSRPDFKKQSELQTTKGMGDVMYLNVGGGMFVTRKSTIESSSFFSSLLDSQPDVNELFVDRDPMHFRHILNWMRGVRYVPDDDITLQELIWECDYYCMHDMRDYIQRIKTRTNLNRTLQSVAQEFKEIVTTQTTLVKESVTAQTTLAKNMSHMLSKVSTSGKGSGVASTTERTTSWGD